MEGLPRRPRQRRGRCGEDTSPATCFIPKSVLAGDLLPSVEEIAARNNVTEEEMAARKLPEEEMVAGKLAAGEMVVRTHAAEEEMFAGMNGFSNEVTMDREHAVILDGIVEMVGGATELLVPKQTPAPTRLLEQ